MSDREIPKYGATNTEGYTDSEIVRVPQDPVEKLFKLMDSYILGAAGEDGKSAITEIGPFYLDEIAQRSRYDFPRNYSIQKIDGSGDGSFLSVEYGSPKGGGFRVTTLQLDSYGDLSSFLPTSFINLAGPARPEVLIIDIIGTENPGLKGRCVLLKLSPSVARKLKLIELPLIAAMSQLTYYENGKPVTRTDSSTELNSLTKPSNGHIIIQDDSTIADKAFAEAMKRLYNLEINVELGKRTIPSQLMKAALKSGIDWSTPLIS